MTDLSVQFAREGRWEEVVSPISFSVAKGEVLGIVGESGAGKSVISLAIMGLLPGAVSRVGGSVDLEGVDLLRLSAQDLQKYRGTRVAMVFQEPMTSLNPVLTCGFQVTETLQRHSATKKKRKEFREEVEQLFTEVGLPDPPRIYRAYPHELSGGQKQRVMIAMALSCNPGLLIADEPTTALDATVQKRILDLLLGIIRSRGMSMIFISHDLGVIRRVSDRVLVMKSGKLVEQGAVAEILREPKEAYTRALIASRPIIGQKLEKLPVPGDFLDNVPAPPGKLISQAVTDSRLKKLYSQDPLIRVRDLKKWYPISTGLFGRPQSIVKALDAVSFDIFPGEIVGLVGESGCGKTTLGRSVLRLIEPTDGTIFWKDQDLLSLGKRDMNRQRTRMQIMFQDPYSSLNPVMTVGASIMEPMKFHDLYHHDRERKDRAIWLLEKVSMKPEHFNRYPHEFSGGQRQRISIARALSMQPEFIVCDETVSALDVSVQAQVLNLLRDLQEEFNLTYLFISHDLSVVYHLCDKILVMNKGRIEENGSAEKIFSQSESAYTRKLLEAAV